MSANIGTKYIPDEGPESNILFVGEAPGVTEENEGRPFVGDSGTILTTCLGRNGLTRESVRIANLCHYRPKDNKFEYLIGSEELASGIKELVAYIERVKPSVICTLGNWPLYFITGKRGKRAGSGILNWRGSILSSQEGVKVIPTIHPAAVLRDRKLYPIFDQDIKRAIDEQAFRDLKLPTREYVVGPPTDKLEYYVGLLSKAEKLAVDIETFGPYLACVGFSSDPGLGVCFVWDNTPTIRDAIQRVLDSPAKKIFHFGTFDTEYLHIQGFTIANYWWDTMVAQHVMWPELPRALKYLTSIYTREPYYKDEGKEALGEDKKAWGAKTDRNKLWIYNCKDATVTREIQEAQEKELNEGPPAWKRFFEFEMKELEIASHISRAGLLVDTNRRQLLEGAVTYKYVKQLDILERLTYQGFNVNSPKQVQAVLYEALKLPVRRKRGGQVTADSDALFALIALCKEKIGTLRAPGPLAEWQRKFLIIKMIMLIRGDRKMLSSYLRARTGGDGRMRSTFKVAATETGRWAAEKYVDGTGCNSQTFPREAIEIPDDLDTFLGGTNLTAKPAIAEDESEEDNEEEDTEDEPTDN